METWQIAGFGIYVHWPFCAAKCPYCDFNSHVVQTVDHARFRQAYLSEIDSWAAKTPGRRVSSVFFGGGTPSLMEPETVAAILDRIRHHWVVANDLEVTLEANPTSVEAGRFREFIAAGVTRFSVGLQALNDQDLKALGRLHSAAEGRAAYDVARSVSDRVSFDLIYARQFQSLDDWRSELREALAMEPDHLSLYQLTIEDGTAFGARAAVGRLPGLPSEDTSANLYEMTQMMCLEAGLPRYEVSNHAVPGQESRHNTIYWQAGDWLGIGPGAHGRLTMDTGRIGTVNVSAPIPWRDAVETLGSGQEPVSHLRAVDVAEEYLLMSLRTRDGLSQSRLRRLGYALHDEGRRRLVELGFLNVNDDQVIVSDDGILVLNQILKDLVPLEPLGENLAEGV
ncbi:coproporphyrinogen III oxidase [Jannaschia pagri]|uniref:Heme chaperone HemW n=1 Tax=Jannaschia pagri TaxID=2829797 RepID=A0ABQ4NLJ4_9RHOB|nr:MULTISPECIES: radical SAM family heme chaperone HemW [unclassified Jannaschia]GIT91454.1 coproporphyrinogen III oxidase [Jannaschia sp. AI_61]GIT95288.1 coproporphyrinogen III oxidase [Jannaschia sp. AI_62]